MGERLIKPYEISVWEDKLIQDGAEYRFEERKLAVIGSDTMTGLNKVYDPVFNKKTNGERTLTFSLKYKYFDPYSGNSDFINPFAALLVNERKVKLHYDNQWYEFIIKDHTESSDELTWTYTCTDAFVLELSKNGYNLTFDSELNNNQGTASELAEKVLKNTDWKLKPSPVLKQLIAEPIYKAVLYPNNGVQIINANNNEIATFNNNTDIYVFYSYIKNQSGQFVQFIIRDENNHQYTIDSNNVITETNYRILTDLTYNSEAQEFIDANDNTIIQLETEVEGETVNPIETRFQANRLAYGQLTTYDNVMGRTVDRFGVLNEQQEVTTEVYKYTDYEYTTSNVVMNYITNGENFNALEDGTLQGWNPYTDQSNGATVNKLELVTYPELAADKELADLSTLSQIEGFLKVQFNGPKTVSEGKIYNTVYNSGIENHASFIHSISKGDKFVFRWRAGQGELGQLTPVKTLGLIVAKYDQDAPQRYGYYYKHIKEEDIIIYFEGQQSSATLPSINNIITGGHLVEAGDGKQNYVIDSVPQVPSGRYIYEDNNESYVWNGISGRFDPLTENNYLPYYYLVAEARESVANIVLSDPTINIGIFIYTTDASNPIFIQDIQLTRFVKDSTYTDEEVPVVIGNIPTATSQPLDYYYVKPKDRIAAEDIETYTKIDELEERLGLEQGSIVPLYNKDSEKTLTISASQSNCFNILQTIAETFECWVDLEVEHDERGYITYDENNKLNKFVCLREYVGKDNYAGFKYGVNLESIERNVNSDEIVSKLIVDQSQSDYVDEGFVSIGLAPSNTSGESYILNFDYYYNQGLLNREKTEADKLAFIEEIAKKNKTLQEYEKEKRDLETSLITLGSNRNVYSELINTAQEELGDALEEFKTLTKMEYADYVVLHNEMASGTGNYTRTISLASQVNWTVDNNKYKGTWEDIFGIWTLNYNGTTLTIIPSKYSTETTAKVINFSHSHDPSIAATYSNDGSASLNIAQKNFLKSITYTFKIEGDDDFLQNLVEEENILETIGQIYAYSSTINNYSGLLTNIEKEYWKIREQLRGSEKYSVKFWCAVDASEQRHIKVDFSDYLVGASFELNESGSIYQVTTSRKYFDLESNDTTITFIVPDKYQIESELTPPYTIETSPQTIEIIPITQKDGVEDEIKKVQDAKDELTNAFNNKYSRFIQEGTWNSTDYIDSEHYYLDALQISNTSAQPIVAYTINVVEISELEGYEWYKFDAGDKSYVEDTEFFGWSNKDGILTPAREEVIVSEVEWHLDEPENNVITVQNYKTRFEDLFQRISAAVQTVQYNEATYAKISTLLDANGTLNNDVLLKSLNNISGQKYTLTTDGSINIDGDQITIRNLTNSSNLVIINNEGIQTSADGGTTWKRVIDGYGVNADAVIAGSINTNQVIIGSSENPSFRWDKSGISAFKSDSSTMDSEGRVIERYDLQTYVRYDEYGLYGIKRGDQFKATSLQDIKDKAHFAVTWDGFFIKNSYPGGGRVEITSDNDFRVLNIVGGELNEKIKIGALEWKQAGWQEGDPIYTDPATVPNDIKQLGPSLYGIRIKNNAGQTVMETGDNGNLKITGTIYANAGEIGGMSVDNTKLVMDHIVLEPGTGIYSDWGETSVYPFIISDVDGSATFNNVVVRGSIKTSVFEYEEIQAVGGAFMFRPSTAIKTATADNGDLVLTVEKPLILRDGAWYKLSNYNSDDSVDADELTTYGLTHIYQLSKTKIGDETEIRLVGGAAILQTIDIDDIPGGSIIDMGFEPNTYRPMKLIPESSPVALHLYELVNGEYVLTDDVTVISDKTYYKEWYQEGINNYGIGINSSDNYINLPPRAISLFETIVNHNQDPKVSYKYRGILGTLPQMRYSGNNPQVSEYYHNYLEGTQGIYTDNMYLGDHDQYITFYEDDNGKKQLRIKANQIMFEIADPEPGQDPWQDIADFDPEGTPGPAGQDAIRVAIESDVGNEFILSQEVATLTCTVYRGAEDVTSQVTKFLWIKNQANGDPDTTWNTAHEDYNLPYIEVTPSEINKKAVFGCRVTLPE